MDALGDILVPYSDAIAKFAGTVTCMQFLSGFFLLNDIRKQGSSDKYPPEVFIGGIVLSALSLKLGTIMDDSAMIKVNIFGIFINILFMYGFYFYASSAFKGSIHKKLAVASLFIMACLAYTNYEDVEKIEVRLGVIITAILLYLVGTPVLHLGEIIKKKSTEGMPFPIIFSGTIVSASWTAYGLSIKNSVMTYQNVLLFVLSAIQLSMFALYPSTPSVEKKEKGKGKAKSSSPAASKKKSSSKKEN